MNIDNAEIIAEIEESMTACYEYLRQDKNLQNDDAAIMKHVNKVKQKMKRLEELVMKETSENVEKEFHDLKWYCNEIETEMKTISDMKKLLQDHHQKHDQHEMKDEFKMKLEAKETELMKMDEMIKMKEKRIEDSKNEIDTMKECFDGEKKKLEDLRNYAKSITSDNTSDKIANPFMKRLMFIEDTFLITDHYVHKNVLTLKFLNPSVNETDFPCLILSVMFNESEDTIMPYSISGVKVDVESFVINDLAKEAIKNNDFKTLVCKVQDRWLKQLPLLQEISNMQKEGFDIEWLKEDHRLKVILPNEKICFLSVPEDYPKGEVLFIKTSDNVLTLKPKTDCSLKGWVTYLHEIFP